jgi:hypothetical protein
MARKLNKNCRVKFTGYLKFTRYGTKAIDLNWSGLPSGIPNRMLAPAVRYLTDSI